MQCDFLRLGEKVQVPKQNKAKNSSIPKTKNKSQHPNQAPANGKIKRKICVKKKMEGIEAKRTEKNEEEGEKCNNNCY